MVIGNWARVKGEEEEMGAHRALSKSVKTVRKMAPNLPQNGNSTAGASASQSADSKYSKYAEIRKMIQNDTGGGGFIAKIGRAVKRVNAKKDVLG